MEAFNYKTEVFEGPLDLLLFLIRKSKVNIYDIPISEITQQFLEYLNNAKNLGLGDLTSFYKMAAELLWIKSRMLLPVEIEFDDEYEDPRQELVDRLLDYQKFKKYSQILSENEDNSTLKIERKKMQFLLPFSDSQLFENIEVKNLLHTYITLMANLDKVSEKVFNVFEEVTIKEKITLLNELLDKEEVVNFYEVVQDRYSREHLITAFIAILDCTKSNMINIKQEEIFKDILITRKEADYDPNLASEYDEEYDKVVNEKEES